MLSCFLDDIVAAEFCDEHSWESNHQCCDGGGGQMKVKLSVAVRLHKLRQVKTRQKEDEEEHCEGQEETIQREWERTFTGCWQKAEEKRNHTLLAAAHTHTHTRAVSHTAVPLGNPKLCCSPLQPWIWPLFLPGKYPVWPDMLNHSLGKSPALLVLAWISGCYMAQQYNVCTCKWLRRHLHLVPLRVCGYTCMCWCFFLFCCVCVWMQKISVGIGIRYSLADWDSAGKSQGQLLIRRKRGEMQAALVGKIK